MSERRISVSKPPYAALWKSSTCRIQLVSGFHLGQICATTSSCHHELAARQLCRPHEKVLDAGKFRGNTSRGGVFPPVFPFLKR